MSRIWNFILEGRGLVTNMQFCKSHDPLITNPWNGKQETIGWTRLASLRDAFSQLGGQKHRFSSDYFSLTLHNHTSWRQPCKHSSNYLSINWACWGGGLRNHPQVWLIQAARLGTCKFMPAGSPALTNIPKHSQLENGPTCSAFMLADSHTPTSASLVTHILGFEI